MTKGAVYCSFLFLLSLRGANLTNGFTRIWLAVGGKIFDEPLIRSNNLLDAGVLFTGVALRFDRLSNLSGFLRRAKLLDESETYTFSLVLSAGKIFLVFPFIESVKTTNQLSKPFSDFDDCTSDLVS